MMCRPVPTSCRGCCPLFRSLFRVRTSAPAFVRGGARARRADSLPGAARRASPASLSRVAMGEGGAADGAADGVGSDAKRRRIASLDRRLGAGRRPGAPSPGAPAGARAGGAAPARGPAHARAPRAASRGPASRGAPDRAPPPRREPDVGSSPRVDPPRSGPRVARGDVVGDPDASWYAPLDARALDAVTTSAGVPPETRERVRRLGDVADAETRREFVRGFLRDLATPGAAPAKTLAPDIHRVIRAKTEEKVLLLDAAEVRADAAEARVREDAARARRRVGGGKGRGAALSAAARRRLGDPLALGNPPENHEDDTHPVGGGEGPGGASARNPGGGDGAATGRRRRNGTGTLARGAPAPGPRGGARAASRRVGRVLAIGVPRTQERGHYTSPRRRTRTGTRTRTRTGGDDSSRRELRRFVRSRSRSVRGRFGVLGGSRRRDVARGSDVGEGRGGSSRGSARGRRFSSPRMIACARCLGGARSWRRGSRGGGGGAGEVIRSEEEEEGFRGEDAVEGGSRGNREGVRKETNARETDSGSAAARLEGLAARGVNDAMRVECIVGWTYRRLLRRSMSREKAPLFICVTAPGSRERDA
jgi:hypothetical protein